MSEIPLLWAVTQSTDKRLWLVCAETAEQAKGLVCANHKRVKVNTLNAQQISLDAPSIIWDTINCDDWINYPID